MQIRPGIVPMDATAPRLQIKLHELAAESIVPCGDRYLIEVVDFDEAFQLGQLLVLTKDTQINLKDPKADPMVEPRGVIGGVVLAVGNGHLLGIPDHAIVEYHQLGDDGEEPARQDPPAGQRSDVPFARRSHPRRSTTRRGGTSRYAVARSGSSARSTYLRT